MMSLDRTFAIAERVIRQIVKDRRSIGMIIVAPIIVMSLVGFSLIEQKDALNQLAPGMLAVFVLFFTFILTGVSFLRERAYGTLERLLTTTVGRADILVGYLLGFLVFTTIQTVVIVSFTILALQIDYKGSLYEIAAVLMLVVVVSVSLGIFISVFARNEFQVVQFVPIVVLPQVFLSGVIIPVDQMPTVLEWISTVLPLTYAVNSLREIMLDGHGLASIWSELAVISGMGVILQTAAVVTLRRT